MEKNKYIVPNMELIIINDDVITSSNETPFVPLERGENETPFVPVIPVN